MKIIYYRPMILFVIAFICCLSCCNNKIDKKIEMILKEWLGQTIKFPDIQPTLFIRMQDSLKYTINGNNNNKEYKILLYVDSIGCTRCKLQLSMWKKYIEELHSKTDFLFYFYPKTENSMLFLFKYELFSYPVYIDKNDELNKLNHFPNNPVFQCFLLDKNNKVLAIGNPVTNYKIWELYKKIITGEISDKLPVTTVEPEQTAIELSDLEAGKISEAIFVLKNTGMNPLVIQRVESSCGCTVLDWEKQPIAVGNSTEIKVKITPEKSEYFNKTVTVHCNIEEGQISFIVKGAVK